MRRSKRQKLIDLEYSLWQVEYRLRFLHLPRNLDNEGNQICAGCGAPWNTCPTLEILDKYWREA